MCRSMLDELSRYHAAVVVRVRRLVARNLIVTRVPHGIAEGGRDSARANALRNRPNPIVGG